MNGRNVSQAEFARIFGEIAWKAANYVPSDEQLLFHGSPARLRLVAGGVGAGKSYSTAMEILRHMGTPEGLGWIIAPSYELANPEFDYCLDVCRELGVVDESTVSGGMGRPRRFSLLDRYGGFELATKSSTNPEAIAGRRPHFIAGVEAAQQPYEMLHKMMERAAQESAPIILSGTFEGAYGWYAELWERWQGPNEEGGMSFSIPTWSNLAKYPGGRNDPKILELERIWPPDLFMERFGGIPCKPEGLVFKEFDRRTHVAPVEELFDPELPVELWVDPATHTYAVLFVQVQRDKQTVHVLDELYEKDTLGQNVIQKVVDTRWWSHSCTNGIIDAAGTRRAGANKSQIEVWMDSTKELRTHPIIWKWKEIRDVRLWYDAIHLRLHKPEGSGPLLKFAAHLRDSLTPSGDALGILGEIKTHRWADRNSLQAMPTRPIKRNEDALSALGYGLYYHFGPVVKRKQGKLALDKPYF
jgi:hypothetical protein